MEVDDDDRETQFYREQVDPWASQIADVEDPWDAYDLAMRAGGAVLDDMVWLPHGGRVYAQWMDLSDLYDHPRLNIAPEDAQRVVVIAARRWLAEGSKRTASHWTAWCETDFWKEAWPGRSLPLMPG